MIQNTLDDFPEFLSQLEKIEQITKLRKKLEPQKFDPRWLSIIQQMEALPQFHSRHVVLDQGMVEIGLAEEMSENDRNLFIRVLKFFIPWKKGPFKLFGEEIDTEWRSDWKWDRIEKHILPLNNRVIADIGCHNGYYMFRMAAQKPKLVIGFEPYSKHWHAFRLLQRYAQVPNICFELLGVEHVKLFPNTFDTIFCLGILYHHTNPIDLLRKMYQSLKKGGELVIDCQGIAGEEPISLTPENRYAQARAIWFLPTLSALKIWLKRTNFRQINCFFDEPLNPSEQRATSWAPIPSLKDFLDPQDNSLTIEGYPAPRRFYLTARKP